jgi:hypothetical protein
LAITPVLSIRWLAIRPRSVGPLPVGQRPDARLLEGFGQAALRAGLVGRRPGRDNAAVFVPQAPGPALFDLAERIGEELLVHRNLRAAVAAIRICVGKRVSAGAALQ